MGQSLGASTNAALRDHIAVPGTGVRVYVLGSFRLFIDGREIRDGAWRRRKALQLFKCLLTQPHRRLSKDQAIELFWPDSDLNAASTNLRTAVYALRQTLHFGAGQLVIEDHDAYSLAPDSTMWVDADAFVASLREARQAPDASPHLEFADTLYRGDYLPDDVYEDWTAARRSQLKRLWTELQFALARLAVQNQEFDRSREVYERLIQADSCDELAAQELMRILRRLGDRSGALRVYQELARALHEDLGVEPSGATTELNKQIALLTEGPHATPVPDIGRESSVGNLPAEPTRIIGRTRELEVLVQKLQEPELRLITLTGPGGVGKTRLAVATALRSQSAFADGAYFVDLAAVRDPKFVMSAVASAIGSGDCGSAAADEDVRTRLQERHTLLILDNFEHVLTAAAEVGELLRSCPNVKVLATSREPLRLSWENVFNLQPLELPDLDRSPEVEQLARVPAVRLLIERGRMAGADLTLTEQNAVSIARLCTRLDGLPLALELAAARLRALSPQLLLNHLDRHLDGVEGRRDWPERHRSLSAAIGWSYNQLNGTERLVFERLAVFSGGCSLEAATAVCAGRGVPADDVVDCISQLVDKSLITVESEPDGSLWYRLLETVRQYASDQLSNRGEFDDTRLKQVEWYVSIADRANEGLRANEQAAWLARLEREHDNLRAVLGWALENRRTDRALRLSAGLWRFWSYRGYWREGRSWLERSLALPGPVDRDRLICFMGAGSLSVDLGDLDVARAYFEQQLALATKPDVWMQRAAALTQLGNLAQRKGDTHAARSLYNEGLSVWQLHGNVWGAANCYIGLAGIALHEGDRPTFRRLVVEALVMRRDSGDNMGVASCLRSLARVDLLDGALASARTRLRESLMTLAVLRTPSGIADALAGLGRVAFEEGHCERALRLIGAAKRQRTLRGGADDDRQKWEIEPWLDSARRTLGDDAYAAAVDAGGALSLEQAVAFALEE